MDPLLLNKGDKISIEVLVTQKPSKISHTVRIVGISEVKSSINTSQDITRGELGGIWAGAGGVGVALLLSALPLVGTIAASLLGGLFATGFISTVVKLLGRRSRSGS